MTHGNQHGGVAVTFSICVRAMSGLNIGRQTGYLDGIHDLPQYLHATSMNASFQIRSSTSFTIRPIIQR
jgi:hypothetical protein